MNRCPEVPPVLLLVFNRPDHTKRCIDAIAKARPSKLFIAADGPRPENATDRIKCEQVQKVLENISWDCEVSTLIRSENLGCQHAVASAIDWFFTHVDCGIILEDDCLADLSFFGFCGQLLDRYANNENVGVVTGNNFQRGLKRGEASYYFSKHNHCWGWATWKRAWNHFDFNMRSGATTSDRIVINRFACGKGEYRYWSRIFRQVRTGKINTWDYRWTYSCWANRLLTVTPQINLVRNIGFDENATHTKSKAELVIPMHFSIPFPLIHPEKVEQCIEADEFTTRKLFRIDYSPLSRVQRIAVDFATRCLKGPAPT